MKLGRRPGTFVSFVDSFTEEPILKVESNENGQNLFTFHLYDSHGTLVADSDGPHIYPDGTEIRDANQELLLLVPSEQGTDIQYRLYSHKGVLITCSDGRRTQIFGGVKMEGNKPLSGRPPASPAAAKPASAVS
ncbi:MAG TPA: hypothetical protein VI759_02905 [Dehalococcoidia bacterium]|nr:hypothetical protein [Dehalococcoidia bacterium]